ncbi:MAG: type I 3-dehydroquinate dehydratase [Syntrophobacteraceae bacterium]|nr:type I 3-dehydroquinate dehydratase [Syntrophobacteraceae bacterium]
MSGARAGEPGGAPGGRICGCLSECSPKAFSEWLNHPGVDLLEWRMDKFAASLGPGEMKPFCQALRARPRLAVIATNRPVRQMGDFDGPEDVRLGMLEEAARCGAEWVDLEEDTDPFVISRFKETGARVLLSWHDPAGTPPVKVLREKLQAMSQAGADAVKIATLANLAEDNLRVLELIPFAGKEFGIELIAFCMGALGKWSRPASLFMGSPWTYAQLEGQVATAPGQFSAARLRELIGALT